MSQIQQESSVRHSEREKNVLVDELGAQNARLTQQLEAANQMEIQLNSKLHELKSQLSIQNKTLQVGQCRNQFFEWKDELLTLLIFD